MSHTTKIDAVTITDIKALKSAIKELKERGVNCELLEQQIPRAYYPNQPGMGTAPYVVKLHDAPYDVGLYETEDGKGYECRTDFWGGHVEKFLGAQNATTPQGRLGKLYNAYSVSAMTRRAVAQGYRVRRVNNADGSVRLQVTGMK